MKRPIQAGIHSRATGQESAEAALREQLKDAAAEWPSGVAAVAVRDGGAFEAITVTSLVVVSLEPPLVLVSIGRHAAIVPLLDAVGRFAVSLLAADQARTASMIADRVPTVRSHFGAEEEPVLRDAVLTLVCATEAVHPAGDHWLYLAGVRRIVPGRQADPLLYHRRGYRR